MADRAILGSNLVENAENGYRLKLTTGTVVYVDTQAEVYLLQPATSTSGRFDTAVPSSLGNTAEGITRTGATYSIGDYVLYATNESTAPAIINSVILTRIPDLKSFFSDRDSNLAEAPKYYKNQEEYLQLAEQCHAGHFLYNWLNEKLGGDNTTESEHVFFRISEYLGRLMAGGGGLTVNAVDSSITEHGLLKHKFLATEQQVSTLVNDTALLDKRAPMHAVLASEKYLEEATEKQLKSLEFPSCRELSGELPYGSVSYVFGGDAEKPVLLSRTDKRRDGVLVHRSVRGFSLEKASSISGYVPDYDRSIYYDDGLKETTDLDRKEYRVPFDRVLDSNCWEEVLSFDDDKEAKSFVRTPGDVDNADSYLPDPEGSTAANVNLFKGSASITWLDSGGILLRDAWGSEIRMENGDIQFSAARHMNFLGGADCVAIFGKHVSVSSKKGFYIGSTDGGLDISVAKDLNAEISGYAHISSAAELSLYSGVNLVLASEGTVSCGSRHFKVDCSGIVQLTGTAVYTLGSGRFIASGGGSCVDLKGGITLAGRGTIVHGSLGITGKAYNAGKINDMTIGSTDTTAGLVVDGNITSKGASISGNLAVKNQVACGTIAVVSPARLPKGGYGVFKASNVTANPPNIQISGNFQVQDSLASEVAYKEAYQITESMFSMSGEGDNIFVAPKFDGKGVDIDPIKTACTVVYKGEKRYIYPGKDFWEKSGVYSVSNVDTAESVLAEKIDKTAKGAVTLRVAK